MKRLMISAAALALCVGTTAAMAQTETNKTTTTVSTPEGTTSTTTQTRTGADGYTRYRRTVTSTKHYDAGPFEAPSGYTYSRYTVGQQVPVLIRDDDNLVLTDYSDYALVTPPAGLEWIRVGDDALLIQRSNGEVIQADYGVFAGDHGDHGDHDGDAD